MISSHDDWDAIQYKKNSQPQFDSAINQIKQLSFNGTETILDVGCGDGKITLELAKKVPYGAVLGIDASKNMIEEAKKSFSPISNLHFDCIDVMDYTSNRSFDLITSFAAFHWVKNQKKALTNLFHSLREGGKLLILMRTKSSSPIEDVFTSEKWIHLLTSQDSVIFLTTKKEMISLLKTCGFKHISIKAISIDRIYPTQEDFFEWIFAWIPHATKFSLKQSREISQDIVNRACELQKRTKNLSLLANFLHIEAFR